MTKTCSLCGQTMPDQPKAGRRCFDCKKPIARHDKWTFVYRDGVVTMAHRHCGNPTEYVAAGEAKQLAPVPLLDSLGEEERGRAVA